MKVISPLESVTITPSWMLANVSVSSSSPCLRTRISVLRTSFAARSSAVRSEMRASSLSFSLMTCASAARRSATWRASSALAAARAAGLGMRSAAGTILTSRIAVGTEARAVTAFTPPDSQYAGCQMVQISMKCEAPQAMMNVAKLTNTHPKRRSRRLRTK